MKKKKAVTLGEWAVALFKFDPERFNYADPEDGPQPPTNLDEAAYQLATWFFDDTKTRRLRAMIEELPEELWKAALKKWANGDHDT